ncbi:MAG: 3-methyl-2-oxobutanoate hydroxymethyltransferase [Pseudomonadota bacterium]
MSRNTIKTLQHKKETQHPIVMLTCYDASFARLAEQAGVDILLVGDSLGMVVQGHETTVPVTLSDMVYHAASVVRASRQAMVIADMPFMSYATPEQAVQHAAHLMQAGGAQMVKLEGGAVLIPTVEHLTERGIPVCAHLGLLPQSIHQLGSYQVQARETDAAEQLLREAQQLQAAGAQLLVLECIPQALAEQVSRSLDIPVIGIGAGPDTDGQVLVLYDVIGISANRIPRFAHNFLAETNSVADAIAAYTSAVHERRFPTAQHTF